MFYSGNSGGIKFGAAAVVDNSANSEIGTGWVENVDVKITNWTVNTTAALLDTTTLGVYDKSSVYGIRTTTGTLRLFYYVNASENYAQSNPSNNAASWFISALLRAETVSSQDAILPPNPISEESIPVLLRLYIDDKKVPGRARDFVDLEANITSVSWGSAVNELVALDVAFEATGQVLMNRA